MLVSHPVLSAGPRRRRAPRTPARPACSALHLLDDVGAALGHAWDASLGATAALAAVEAPTSAPAEASKAEELLSFLATAAVATGVPLAFSLSRGKRRGARAQTTREAR